MKDDIGELLNNWSFDPDEFIARRITASDGTEKIQIRIDMGVLQLEVEGRPDGERPHDFHRFYPTIKRKLSQPIQSLSRARSRWTRKPARTCSRRLGSITSVI